jgi:hypothetical protein
MTIRCQAFLCAVVLFVSFSGYSQTEPKPHRTVKLPRYMTDISQPIPPQIMSPEAPKTARDVNCFISFSKTTSMKNVIRKCGVPDEHQGSGIDGSVVAIGTGDLDHLMYVNHIKNSGGRLLLADAAPVSQVQSFTPRDGVVPDPATAVKIAEAVLVPVYGKEKIESERPFTARLENGVWSVKGTLHCSDGRGGATTSCVGGTAEVKLSKEDGRILKVIHYK